MIITDIIILYDITKRSNCIKSYAFSEFEYISKWQMAKVTNGKWVINYRLLRDGPNYAQIQYQWPKLAHYSSLKYSFTMK